MKLQRCLITFLLIQSTLTQGRANSVIETRQLVQGNSFEREMKGGEIHRYRITFADGQLFTF